MNSHLAIRSLPLAADLFPPGERERIAAMTIAELRQALTDSLTTTATALIRLALVVQALETKGEDVSELRVPLLTYLRRIATGQLLPGVVARFAENPALVRKVEQLPVTDQERLADGQPVQLVVRGANGEPWTHRLADPSKLDAAQRGQVFAADHLRSAEEQILLLESRGLKAAAPPTPRPRTRKAQADVARGGIVIGSSFATAEDVLKALAELKGTPALLRALEKLGGG